MANVGFYGFGNVFATIAGPGGFVDLTSGSAEDGITISAVMDQSTAEYGADGSVAHSLSAVTARNVTVRILKTSPANAILQDMFRIQNSSASLNGTNTITIRDGARGDTIVLSDVAFQKMPDLNFAKEAGSNEWTFIAAKSETILGGL